MAGSIERRGEKTYRLIVSTGKNLDDSRARRTKTIHETRKDADNYKEKAKLFKEWISNALG